MKKKVAFIVTALNSGGIENYLLRFLTYQSKKINATVYCRANFIGDLQEDYERANVKIVPFKLGYINVLNYLSFYKELKQNKFDTIVDFCGNISGLTLFTAKFASINKRIVFYRNSSDRFKKDSFRMFYDYLMKVLVRSYATEILANSKVGLEFYYPEYSEKNKKSEVIYNGIDAESFIKEQTNLRKELGINEDSYVIGHVGRYNSAKNHDCIIKVAEILCKKYSKITFVLCGIDVDKMLTVRIKDLGLTEQVKLLGYRKDVIRVLNTLDCFYFPSLTEGQPNALIEAMVVGLPFVASNIPSIIETVHSDYHNQLVSPEDIDEAAFKLEQLFKGEVDFSLKNWATNYFRPDFWFNRFLDKL